MAMTNLNGSDLIWALRHSVQAHGKDAHWPAQHPNDLDEHQTFPKVRL
jgi:hypothetical protein